MAACINVSRKGKVSGCYCTVGVLFCSQRKQKRHKYVGQSVNGSQRHRNKNKTYTSRYKKANINSGIKKLCNINGGMLEARGMRM